jgi:hypothetical protein
MFFDTIHNIQIKVLKPFFIQLILMAVCNLIGSVFRLHREGCLQPVQTALTNGCYQDGQNLDLHYQTARLLTEVRLTTRNNTSFDATFYIFQDVGSYALETPVTFTAIGQK